MKKFLSEVSFWAQAIPLGIVLCVWYAMILAAGAIVAAILLGIVGMIVGPIFYYIFYFMYWLSGGH